MKRTLLEILCCPVCKGDLELTVDEEDETEIVKGTLHCNLCKVDYPVEEGIPDLLPRTPVQ
jgi:uncharacterized protein